jgi:hypothetical protein
VSRFLIRQVVTCSACPRSKGKVLERGTPNLGMEVAGQSSLPGVPLGTVDPLTAFSSKLAAKSCEVPLTGMWFCLSFARIPVSDNPKLREPLRRTIPVCGPSGRSLPGSPRRSPIYSLEPPYNTVQYSSVRSFWLGCGRIKNAVVEV